jgi:hypothetical protein
VLHTVKYFKYVPAFNSRNNPRRVVKYALFIEQDSKIYRLTNLLKVIQPVSTNLLL